MGTSLGQQHKGEWRDPKSIKFTGDTINYFFQRGPPKRKGTVDAAGVGSRRGDESVQSLLEKLSSGAVAVTDIPRIRVAKYKDSWYSPDNARLWVFRQLGLEIPVELIERPTNAFLTRIANRLGDGEAVSIIKDPEKKVQTHEHACKQELLNRILKWSVRDLLSSRPLQEMAPIPVQHTKVEDYLELLSQWLLEETRAQIQQSLLKISDLACTELNIDSDVRPINKKNALKRLSFSTDHDRCVQFRRSKNLATKVYHPASSDIVLLVTFVPQNPGELFQAGECCTLAVIQGGQAFNAGSEKSFEAIIHAATHGPVYKELREGEKKWYAVKLESMVTCQRIWDALHQPEATPMATYIATYSQPKDVEPAISRPLQSGVDESKLQMYCRDIRGLNESQAEAVESFIARLLNKESGCGLGLIQGPPGTGKTSTLTAMLSATACSSARILVCAPTNTAVNEAAQRFLVQRQEDLDDDCQILHFCSDAATPGSPQMNDDGSINCARLRLGDIVMLGSEDRLTVEGSVLESIFLPLRVKRLLAALHPETGWDFLSKTFMMHLMEVSSPTADDLTRRLRGHSVIKDFGRKVVAHGETLCNDLPSAHLSAQRMEMIEAALRGIRKVLDLLSTEHSESPPQISPPLSPRSSPQQFSPQPRGEGEDEDDGSQETMVHGDDAPQFSPRPCQDVIELDDSDDGDDNAAPQLLLHPLGESVPADPEPVAAVADMHGEFVCSDFIRERQALLEILATISEEFPVFPAAAAASPEWLEAQCVENASLVFSTVSSVGLRVMKLGSPFSCIIVDEAAQLVEAETAIITQMKGVMQLVLVGDQKQLPATVMSQLAQKYGYGRSLFERLQKLGHPWLLLDVQYRMHPAISAFPSKQFYNHKLKNGDNVLEEHYGRASFQRDLYGPYAFIDVADGFEENAGSSKKNPLEAEIVLQLIQSVRDSGYLIRGHNVVQRYMDAKMNWVSGPEVEKIKVGFIKDRMSNDGHVYISELGAKVLDVEVKSIDGFQGKETDIIIFSAVRANQAGRIGFVDDERRMNVALTRGRYAVWILGSASTLGAHSRLWRDLIDDAKQAKRFFSASREEGMSKLINKYRQHHKPVLKQRGEDTGIKEFDKITKETPRWSFWESYEPPVNDGPDWSAAQDYPGEEATVASPEVKWDGDGLRKKRPRSTGWGQPSKSFESPPEYHGSRMVNRHQWYRHRERFEPLYRGRRWGSSTGRHGWGPSPSAGNNRSARAFSPGPFQMNCDVHITFGGEPSCNEAAPVHGWDDPTNFRQSEGQPNWGDVDRWYPDGFEPEHGRQPHHHSSPPHHHHD